ncbi:unnamed protein product [Leptosia nina]|uniref:Uncharacterized protein n=1 Tax=Leptosia nina TaxID=320188 RepID=A0AAV1ISB0_9NEOP
MTLSINSNTLQSNSIVEDISTDWKILYNSQLWNDSQLRKEFIKTPFVENKAVTCCYTCRGKVRNYEVTPPGKSNFLPGSHSTPKTYSNTRSIESDLHGNFTIEEERNEPGSQIIPSISRQVDTSYRQKYTCAAYDSRKRFDEHNLRSLKGARCVFNSISTESLSKKKTQLKACSISVMILAVVTICLVLVNFSTPILSRANNTSTTVVPTIVNVNETSSAIVSVNSDPTTDSDTTQIIREDESTISGTKVTVSDVIAKIRNNIKTYPKTKPVSELPKDIINRDLSQKFCSCQKNEVCMLDEDSGTSICKIAADIEDPTGCGGLCALETEACQLVDKERGIRVCRLLTLENCSSHDWRCSNGLCVPANARCDGSIQCYDRSDEKHCDCDLTKEFRCGHSLSCFPNKKICDGTIDCWDGFDEVNCTSRCVEDQFPCNDGQCILPSRFCDGFADCADGSDEPHGCEGSCGTHELQCFNRRCVSLDVKCDGRDDCGDNTDETQCF